MVWRVVPGFDGYEVSDFGFVRSVNRTLVDRLGRTRQLRGRPVQVRRHTNGYLNVQLGLSSGNLYVHRLVMLAFVGPCPPGQEVLHANGDKTDNRLVNLRYGTRSENNYDTVAQGQHVQARKTVCSRGHLYSGANLRFRPHGRGRVCRACKAAHDRVSRDSSLVLAVVADEIYAKIMDFPT